MARLEIGTHDDGEAKEEQARVENEHLMAWKYLRFLSVTKPVRGPSLLDYVCNVMGTT